MHMLSSQRSTRHRAMEAIATRLVLYHRAQTCDACLIHMALMGVTGGR